MDLDIAQNLMLGIATATNNFQDSKTSSLAFEMAGVLMRNGALRPSSNFNVEKKINNGFCRDEKPFAAEASFEQTAFQKPRRIRERNKTGCKTAFDAARST